MSLPAQENLQENTNSQYNFHKSNYLKVSQAAKILGISPSSLRRFEEDGKISSERCVENNYRVYRLDLVNRLKEELEERKDFKKNKSEVRRDNKIIASYNIANVVKGNTTTPNLTTKKSIDKAKITEKKHITPIVIGKKVEQIGFSKNDEPRKTPNSLANPMTQPNLYIKPTYNDNERILYKQKTTRNPFRMPKYVWRVGTSLAIASFIIILFSSFNTPSKPLLNIKNVLSSVSHRIKFSKSRDFIEERKIEYENVLAARTRVSDFIQNFNLPIYFKKNATFEVGLDTTDVRFNGTGTIYNLQAIDEVTKNTLELSLSIDGEVTGTNMRNTVIANGVIDENKLSDEISYDGNFDFAEGSLSLEGTPIEATADEINYLSDMEVATGGILFGDGSTIAQDVTSLFWDNTNKRLGIGTDTPTGDVTITPSQAAALQINQYGTSAGSTGEVRFTELTTNGDNYTGFKAPDSLSENIIYTLPSGTPSEDWVLTWKPGNLLTWSSSNGDISAVGSVESGRVFSDLSADDQWLGLGELAGRIEFDNQTIDEINFLDTRVGIGTSTPQYTLDVDGTISTTSLRTTGIYISGTQVTASAAELNVLDGIASTLTSTELNVLDGIAATLTSTELNLLDGRTGTLLDSNNVGTYATTGVTAGAGLIDGGTTGVLTLNIGSGPGITVSADSISLDITTSGTSASTSSNSGLELSDEGLRLLGGCANDEVLSWDSSNKVWKCSGKLASGGVTGSGVSGQITFWNGSSTITGSDNLFWDIAQSRLGIGTTNPTYSLQVAGSFMATDYFSGSGTQGASTTVSGLTFQDGLYTSGTISGFLTTETYLGTVTSITSGSGMNFSEITSTGSITLGTPSSLSASSTNAVTATSHTHEITSYALNGSTGDITITGSPEILGSGTATASLTATGVTAGTYGSSTIIPIFSVDSKGRLNLASTAAGAFDTARSFYSGLTVSGTGVTLGGALTQSTTITQDAAESLTFANSSSANTIFNLISTGDFDIQDNGTSVFYVKDDGKIGIGTTNPTYKLQVAGSFMATDYFSGSGTQGASTTVSGLTFQDGLYTSGTISGFLTTETYLGTVTAVGSMTTGDTFNSSSASGQWLGLGAAAGRIQFYDSGTDSIALMGANIGIGTSNPSYTLDISGDLRLTGRFYDSNSSAGTNNWYLQSTGTGTIWTDLSSSLLPIGTEGQMLYNNSGTWTPTSDIYWDDTLLRLGIGTSSPSATLSVAGDESAISNDTGDITITPASNLIVSQGNVGIGNSTPGAYKLNVTGSFIATDYFSGDETQGAEYSTSGLVFKDGLYVSGTFGGTDTNTTYTAGNGLTLSGTQVQLGGTLSQSTSVVAGNFDMIFNMSGTGDFRVQDGGTDVLFVSSDGKIGIGTTNPTYKLQVAGSFMATDYFSGSGTQGASTTVSGLTFQDGLYTSGTISGFLTTETYLGTITAVGSMTTGDTFNSSSASGQWLGLGATAGRILFNSAATDTISLMSANVGIGTSNPTSKIEIIGSGTGSDTSSLLIANALGNTTLYAQDNGYIGLGTTNPQYILDIYYPSSYRWIIGEIEYIPDDSPGLNDITAGGTFTGSEPTTYIVYIDSEGTPDTFSWSDDFFNTSTDNVPITAGTAQSLSNGVTVTFSAGTGHTLYDSWQFELTSTNKTNLLGIQNWVGEYIFHVGNDGYVGIGTSNPTASLEIAGSDPDADLLRIKDWYGTDGLFVNYEGKVGIGTEEIVEMNTLQVEGRTWLNGLLTIGSHVYTGSPYPGDLNSKVHIVSADFIYPNYVEDYLGNKQGKDNDNNKGLLLFQNFDYGVATDLNWNFGGSFNAQLDTSSSSSSLSNVVGLEGLGIILQGKADKVIGVKGVGTAGLNQNTANVNSMYGGYFESYTGGWEMGPGIAQNAYGIYSHVYEDQYSNTITNGYGIYSKCENTEKCYGIYIDSNDLGLYVESDDNNYLESALLIGSSTPNGYKLEVSGTADALAKFYSSDDLAQILLSDNDTTGYFNVKDGILSLGRANGLSSSNLNINSSGNVGIGNTTPGAYKLNVAGSFMATDYFAGDGTQGADATVSGLVFKDGLYTSGTISITDTNTTYTAGNGLTLSGTQVQLGGTLAQSTSVVASNYDMIFNLNGTGSFDIQDSGVSSLYVSGSSGNVGIGTTNPAEKLDIVGGNIRTDSSLISGNGIFGYGQGTGVTDRLGGQAKFMTGTGYIYFERYNSGVSMDDSTGNLTGYAYSDDLGWITFGTDENSLGPVNVNLTTGAVTGKAKVINSGSYVDFTNYSSNVTVNLETGIFSGYVWSEDAGWIDFSDTGVYFSNNTITTYASNQDLFINPEGDGVTYISGNVTIDGAVYANAFSSNSPLLLQTAGTTRIYIDDETGYIGIGNTDPLYDLHLTGNMYLTGGIIADGSIKPQVFLNISNDEWDSINIGLSLGVNYTTSSKPAFTTSLLLKENYGASGFELAGYYSTASTFYGRTHNDSGSWNSWVTFTTSAYSDLQLKKDIVPIDDALEKIMALEGVYFNWRADEYTGYGFDYQRQIGMIAQEVEKIFPQLVTTDPNGLKTLEYRTLTALLIQGVKEQQTQIEDLKASILGITETSESTESEDTSLLSQMQALFDEFKSFVSTLGMTTQTDELGNEFLVINSDVNILGDVSLTDLNVMGNLQAGAITIDTIENSIDILGVPCYNSETNTKNEELCIDQTLYLQKSSAGNLDIFDGKLVIEPDGTMKLDGSLEVTGKVTAQDVETTKINIDSTNVASASAGKITILAGETSVQIQTSTVTENSIIMVTPEIPIAVGSKYIEPGVFEIALKNPELEDLQISWFIVGN